MITFPCSRCKSTCQADPTHTGWLHKCEYCGLILTVPGKRVSAARRAKRGLGAIEILIGGGAAMSLVAAAVVVSALSNRPVQAARPAADPMNERIIAPAPVVAREPEPVPPSHATPASAGQQEPVVVIIE